MNFDFTAVLTRAWKITWENKILWIFGILAGLGNGSGAGSNVRFSTPDFGSGPGGQPRLPPEVARFFERLENADPAIIAVIIGLVCVLLLIGLVFFVLSVIGRGGLIGGANLAGAQGRVSFGEAWAVGLSNFWRLFLIQLMVGVVVFVLVLLLIIPGALLTALTAGIGLICFLPLICVFVIVAIVLSIIAYFAQIAAVLENLSVMDALRRSWEVLRGNLGPIIVLGIIFIVLGGIIGFVSFLPIVLIVLPAFIGMMGLATENQAVGVSSLAIAGLCFVAYLPVLLVINGVLQTWVTSTWTLAFRQFTRPAASAPLSTVMPQP